MFIRTKTIKGTKYAYLVKNQWSRKTQTPKQKVVQYLGKVFSLAKQSETSLAQNLRENKNLKDISLQDALIELVQTELINNRFRQEGAYWTNGCFFVIIGPEKPKVYNQKNQDICLELNEGFLSSYTLKELFSLLFIPTNKDKLSLGKEVGNILLSAGIKLDQNTFLQLFDKLLKKDQKLNKKDSA